MIFMTESESRETVSATEYANLMLLFLKTRNRTQRMPSATSRTLCRRDNGAFQSNGLERKEHVEGTTHLSSPLLLTGLSIWGSSSQCSTHRRSTPTWTRFAPHFQDRWTLCARQTYAFEWTIVSLQNKLLPAALMIHEKAITVQ